MIFFFLLVLTTIGTEAQQARLLCKSRRWFEARAPPDASQQLVAVPRGSSRSYVAQPRLGKACTDWLSNRVARVATGACVLRGEGLEGKGLGFSSWGWEGRRHLGLSLSGQGGALRRWGTEWGTETFAGVATAEVLCDAELDAWRVHVRWGEEDEGSRRRSDSWRYLFTGLQISSWICEERFLALFPLWCVSWLSWTRWALWVP